MQRRKYSNSYALLFVCNLYLKRKEKNIQSTARESRYYKIQDQFVKAKPELASQTTIKCVTCRKRAYKLWSPAHGHIQRTCNIEISKSERETERKRDIFN